MWQEQAACASVPVDVFFAEDATQAKQVCAECPVKAECLEANMGERFGIFGGTTPEERALSGGADNPLPEDFTVNSRGSVVDEGIPEPDEPAPVTMSFKPSYGEDFTEQCVELYAEGFGIKVIGAKLNAPHSTVRRHLLKAGVEMRPVGSVTPMTSIVNRRKNPAKVAKSRAARDAELTLQVVALYKSGLTT